MALAAPLQSASAQRAATSLRPGDALRIQVRDEPTWSGTFQIAEDGTVLLPTLGIVQVAGRPFAEVRAELSAAYRRELVVPEVQIVPLVRVAVLGEVQRPGLFPVDPTQGLADLLATAGGLTPSGDRNGIRLVRDGTVVATRLDPNSETLGLPLQSGDQVFVTRRSWLAQNAPILVGALASVTTAVVASLLVR